MKRFWRLSLIAVGRGVMVSGFFGVVAATIARLVLSGIVGVFWTLVLYYTGTTAAVLGACLLHFGIRSVVDMEEWA